MTHHPSGSLLRRLIALLAVAWLSSTAPFARADSYHWGGPDSDEGNGSFNADWYDDTTEMPFKGPPGSGARPMSNRVFSPVAGVVWTRSISTRLQRIAHVIWRLHRQEAG